MAKAATINVHSGSMFIRAWDRVGAATEDTLSASFPLDTSRTVVDGQASNTTEYLYDDSGFLITVEHVRAFLSNAHTQSSHTLPIEFSVDEDTPYELSGFYNMTGADRIAYYAQLTDASAGDAVLFRNQQQSFATSNESFVLGNVAGDATGMNQFLLGGLTGTLVAGHHYKLEFNFLIQHVSSNAAASAAGELRLRIGESGLVPEPGTITLTVLAFAAFAACIRSRR